MAPACPHMAGDIMNKQGLSIDSNSHNSILLDPDNIFWAVTYNKDKAGLFISRDVLTLYEKIKDKISKEINDFRFSQGLTAIYVDPTDKCNANCSYCYVPHHIRKNGRSMTRGELDFILNKLAKHFQNNKRKQVIIFHASEPLLVKEIIFYAIIKYNKIFKFGLQTNAILLEKKDVEFLKKHKVGVGISLDSYSLSRNNRLRPAVQVGGNFANAVRAIEWFDGYKGLNVITTVTKFNVEDLPRIVKFLHTKKVPCVLMNPVRFTKVSMRALKPQDKIMAKYFKKAVDTAINLSINSKHKIIIGNFSNTILAIIAPVARRLMCDISPCGGGRCFFTITASGNMIPCGEFIGLKGFSGGNIFKTSVNTAMESKPFKRIRSRVVERIKECDICNFRNICGAPCPAELHSFGNMHQKAVFCDFYKEIIRYAFKLIAEDKVKYLLRDESSNSFKYNYNLGAVKK
ncbi:MAG: peptide-modifying radical SAM enzyme CbpB [Candidatus Omnitrophota bacterium]